MNTRPLFRLFSMMGLTAFALAGSPFAAAAETNIRLLAPTANERVGNPIIIEGSARVFESAVRYRIRDVFGNILTEGNALAQASDVGRFGPFTVRANVNSPLPTSAMVELFNDSAQDGSVQNLAQAGVTFANTTELNETQPFYRFYQQTRGAHFYTTDSAQRQTALQLRYRDEGTAGWLYRYSASDRIPLFHLYNASTRDHFYTTNELEKNLAISRLGYVFERIEGYAHPTQTLDRMPLYRLYNPRNRHHFYTNNAAEVTVAMQRYGFRSEGVTAYLPRR